MNQELSYSRGANADPRDRILSAVVDPSAATLLRCLLPGPSPAERVVDALWQTVSRHNPMVLVNTQVALAVRTFGARP